MTTTDNRIPSALARVLFPNIEAVGTLSLDAGCLRFEAEAMPLLHPHEQMILAAVTRWRAPRRILEIGTGQGRSTRILAANALDDATVVTIDLPPEDRGAYSRSCLHGDQEVGRHFADAPVNAQIRQIFCDSRQLQADDLRREHETPDLILVDGDHGYDAVRHDTELALALAGPRTVILWHDFYTFPAYIAEGRERRGVYAALNELAEENRIVLRHVIGTYYVAGCPEWPRDKPGRILPPGSAPGPFGQGIVRLAASAFDGWAEG